MTFQHALYAVAFAVIAGDSALADTPPLAYFQLATPSGAGDLMTIYRVPVVTSTGAIVYKDVQIQFDVSASGGLTLRSGYPIVTNSVALQSGNFIAGRYKLAGYYYQLSGPGAGPSGRTSWSLDAEAAACLQSAGSDDRAGGRPPVADPAHRRAHFLWRIWLWRPGQHNLRRRRHPGLLGKLQPDRRRLYGERADPLSLHQQQRRRPKLPGRLGKLSALPGYRRLLAQVADDRRRRRRDHDLDPVTTGSKAKPRRRVVEPQRQPSAGATWVRIASMTCAL